MTSEWTSVGTVRSRKDAAKKLLLDLPNLFAVLQAEAGKLSNFNASNLQAAAKN